MDYVHAQQTMHTKVQFNKFYRTTNISQQRCIVGWASSRDSPEPRVVEAEMEVMTTAMPLFLSIEFLGGLWYFLSIPKILCMS